MNASQAIARSISHNEIVTLEYDETIAKHLRELSDDWVEANDRIEYWGTDDGDEWRVHLRQVGGPDEQS